MEEAVAVRCRPQDVGIVKNVGGDAVRTFEQATKKTCKVTIDSSHLSSEWYDQKKKKICSKHFLEELLCLWCV